MKEATFKLFKEQLARAGRSDFYRKRYKEWGLDPADIRTPEDIKKIPFTDKGDLRDAYPLGIQAAGDEEIVRIHSSSGTTGQPVIIPYTRRDVEDWAIMMKRCYEFAGLTNLDRIQITPGYGLWTAGIGFQAGCELLGAMAVPMGPGNTEKQLKMMMDLKSTALTSTSSYALLLAETVQQRGLQDKIYLKKGVIGSEHWGDKMRRRISEGLGIDVYDIYGLTEVYGPGISIDCALHKGLHYFDDYLYFEIIDPLTGECLPDGEMGELVITTLRKEGGPLIRYRTHDITRLLPGECGCGSPYPRHDRIQGRTDDMVKVKGVNIYPAQMDGVLRKIDGVSSEYLIEINHFEGKDEIELSMEAEEGADFAAVEEAVFEQVRREIGVRIRVRAFAVGTLPRSEKKTKRIKDNRQE